MLLDEVNPEVREEEAAKRSQERLRLASSAKGEVWTVTRREQLAPLRESCSSLI